MTSKRENFIKLIEEVFRKIDIDTFIADSESGKAGLEYWEEFKTGKPSKGGITESGAKILQYMVENEDKYNNIFKAKDIGEGLFMSSRSVSGSMRKLVTDGYCIKAGNDPVCYSLTEQGKNFSVDN